MAPASLLTAGLPLADNGATRARSSMDRVAVFETVGCGFESRRARLTRGCTLCVAPPCMCGAATRQAPPAGDWRSSPTFAERGRRPLTLRRWRRYPHSHGPAAALRSTRVSTLTAHSVASREPGLITMARLVASSPSFTIPESATASAREQAATSSRYLDTGPARVEP